MPRMDAHGYVMATIPATTSKPGVPVIGFIAHVDTSPEMSGAGVKPIVHRAFDGHDLVLPDDPSAVLRVQDSPYLGECIGHDIVTASGTTLLGADNKCGVAEIMTAAERLMAHPEIAHGTIRIAFTPDEEVGRGTAHFDVARFGAHYAYTMDGGPRGELEYESFSADAITLTFRGFNTHPGYAKGRMVNAIKLAARFIDRLPADRLSPETTEGREGFVHPYVVAGRRRPHLGPAPGSRLRARRAEGEGGVARVARRGSRSRRARRVVRGRRRGAVSQHARGDRPAPASRRLGRARRSRARASRSASARSAAARTARGCRSWACRRPNIFAGEQNFHSRLEWVSVQDMEKAVDVIVDSQRCGKLDLLTSESDDGVRERELVRARRVSTPFGGAMSKASIRYGMPSAASQFASPPPMWKCR